MNLMVLGDMKKWGPSGRAHCKAERAERRLQIRKTRMNSL